MSQGLIFVRHLLRSKLLFKIILNNVYLPQLSVTMKNKFLTVAILSGVLNTNQLLANATKYNFDSLFIKQDVVINGSVHADGKALSGATVTLVELQIVTATNAKGEFTFNNLPKGNYSILVQYTGMKSQTAKVNLSQPIRIDLQGNTIDIDGVQVVGERSTVKGATSTHISRQAIEHLQATSIAEVLQLLPGQTITNPDFSRMNSPSIRQISSDPSSGTADANARKVSSIGTSIIINGAQLSNNADMQAVNTSVGGTLSSFNNSTGLGTDLRQISADNVESIEVIRGIPSVEYGELTSGVIDVKTKASVEPLQAKFRLNPTAKQVWVGQGFAIGKDQGALFVDVDYTHAASSQRTASESYQRFNTSFQYTNRFGSNKNLYTNTTLALGGYYDDAKIDPDLEINQVINKAENYDLRFSTNGRWTLDKKFARSINYVLSSQLGFQNGFQQQINRGEISAVSNSIVDATKEVEYLPSSYLQQIYLKGKPLNIQAKISDNFYLFTGEARHAFMIGASYTMDKNLGEGRSFGEGLQPRTNDGLGYRPRKFSDIPALNQLAFYAEDKVNVDLFGKPLNILAGLRYDVIQLGRDDKKSALSPRINASYDIFDNVTLRGGYGLSAKAPSLIYLYPDPVFVDIFSLNYYKQDPNERLALMTTRVFSAENKDLEMAVSKKAEIGVDYKKFSVTLYKEKVDNGFDLYPYYNFANVPMYSVANQLPGQKPELSADIKDSLYIVDYNRATNGVNIENKGIEFDFDFGRWKAIRTSFILNGAYSYTKRLDNNPYVYARRVANQPYNQLGVFEGRGREYSRFLTTLRTVHQIPEIRLLVTLTAQTIWSDKNKYLNYTNRPYGVIDVLKGNDGSVRMLSASEIAAIPETSGLYLSVSDDYYKEESWKPLWLFNTKVTKEFGMNYGFSFYVNNITNSRPYVQSKRNPTQYEKRNIPIFFGSELTIKF